MKYRILASCAALLGLAVSTMGSALAQDTEADRRAKDPRNKNYIVGEKKSGYVFMTALTRDMQDDDFANPAFTVVDVGQEQWNKVNGKAGKSCASCHNDIASMKGVANKYPQYDSSQDRMISLQHLINRHLEKDMGAKPWKWESTQMLGMVALIKSQSRGMPVNVRLDGPAKKFFEKGREFYNQRRGQMDMSCAHCHDDNYGNMARSNVLSQGQMNGFPTYRFKWQGVGSLHRRFIGCNKNIRATPYKRGSEEYTNLELYMQWRSSGLKWESPSVRN
jgi:sulfur-oxidizing protein SoxA